MPIYIRYDKHSGKYYLSAGIALFRKGSIVQMVYIAEYYATTHDFKYAVTFPDRDQAMCWAIEAGYHVVNG